MSPVSTRKSSQKGDSSTSLNAVLNFEMNSARDRDRWAARQFAATDVAALASCVWITRPFALSGISSIN